MPKITTLFPPGLRLGGNLTSSYRPNSGGIKENQLKLAWSVPGNSKLSGVSLEKINSYGSLNSNKFFIKITSNHQSQKCTVLSKLYLLQR